MYKKKLILIYRKSFFSITVKNSERTVLNFDICFLQNLQKLYEENIGDQKLALEIGTPNNLLDYELKKQKQKFNRMYKTNQKLIT